jgi:hypothetical protein
MFATYVMLACGPVAGWGGDNAQNNCRRGERGARCGSGKRFRNVRSPRRNTAFFEILALSFCKRSGAASLG